jgi:hypothetical protein
MCEMVEKDQRATYIIQNNYPQRSKVNFYPSNLDCMMFLVAQNPISEVVFLKL